MQIRSMQAVALTKRQQPKPPTFSSLKSKNGAKSDDVNADLPKNGKEGDSKTQLGAASLSGGTGACENSKININGSGGAVSAAQLVSNKTLLERNSSKQTHGTHTNQAMGVSGTRLTQPSRAQSVESNSKQRRVDNNLQVKKQLQQQKRVSTIAGFILGVMEEDDETPDGTPQHLSMLQTQVFHHHQQVIHSSSNQNNNGHVEEDAEEDGMVHNMVFDNQMMMMPRTQGIDTQQYEGSKLPTARNEDSLPQEMLDDDDEQIVQKPSQPIKVLATTTKKVNVTVETTAQKQHQQQQQRPIWTAERFDVSNSVQMESAMKPVRLASGYSDDATPQSNTILQPRGLQNMMNNSFQSKNEGGLVTQDKKATQFTVLTSHYQEQQLQLAQAQKLLLATQQKPPVTDHSTLEQLNELNYSQLRSAPDSNNIVANRHNTQTQESNAEQLAVVPVEGGGGSFDLLAQVNATIKQSQSNKQNIINSKREQQQQENGVDIDGNNSNTDDNKGEITSINIVPVAVTATAALQHQHQQMIQNNANKSPTIGNGIVQDQDQQHHQMFDLDLMDNSELNQMLMTQKSAQNYSSQPQVNSQKSFKLDNKSQILNNHAQNMTSSSQKLQITQNTNTHVGGKGGLYQSLTGSQQKPNNQNNDFLDHKVITSITAQNNSLLASPLVISQMRPQSKKKQKPGGQTMGKHVQTTSHFPLESNTAGLLMADENENYRNQTFQHYQDAASSSAYYLGAFKQSTFRKKRSTSTVHNLQNRMKLTQNCHLVIGKNYKLNQLDNNLRNTSEAGVAKKGTTSVRGAQTSQPKRMRTSFEIKNRRIMVSNDSWQSSNNSKLLNQDLMSAKIENCTIYDGNEAILIPTQGGQSSESLGEGYYDKAGDYAIVSNAIMVQKLAESSGQSNVRQVPTSEKLPSKKTFNKKQPPTAESNKVTVFATIEAQKRAEINRGANSPLIIKEGLSPKRKSVLSRNSKASPKLSLISPQPLKELPNIQMRQPSNVQTLNGTISSQEREIRADSLQLNEKRLKSTELAQNKNGNEGSDERDQMFTGPSLMANSQQRISKEITSIAGKQQTSGFTLKRDSSEEIQMSQNVILSRVVSNEQLHAETMRQEHNTSSPYKPEISADDQFELRKKCLSMETASQDLITNGNVENNQTPLQGKGSIPDQNDLSAGNKNLLQMTQYEQALDKRTSSHAFVATSLGEESFIQPPSPIHQNDHDRRLFDSKYAINSGILSKGLTPEENTGSDVTFIKQAKGNTNNNNNNNMMFLTGGVKLGNINKSNNNTFVGEETVMGLHIKAQSTHEVIDVMHAGVDTQDFVELSGSEHTLHTSQQDCLMIDSREQAALMIGQLDPSKTSDAAKINLNFNRSRMLGGQESELRSGLESSMVSRSPQLDGTMSSLKMLKAGQSWPIVSCLCKELELTPEQFGQVVQQYKRYPRVIIKSDVEPNRILLVNQDGTSKDANMMEDIIQGTIKVDGISIQKLVHENQEYFHLLKKNEESPHRKRIQATASVHNRRGSDHMIGSSTNRTIDKNLMTQQLEKFVQYGQEFSATTGHGSITNNVIVNGKQRYQQNENTNFSTHSMLKSRHHSKVLHSKCEAIGGAISGALGETELNTPAAMLMNAQYNLHEQYDSKANNKMETAAANQQVFQTQRNTEYLARSSKTNTQTTSKLLINGQELSMKPAGFSMMEDHPYSNKNINVIGGNGNTTSQPTHRLSQHLTTENEHVVKSNGVGGVISELLLNSDHSINQKKRHQLLNNDNSVGGDAGAEETEIDRQFAAVSSGNEADQTLHRPPAKKGMMEDNEGGSNTMMQPTSPQQSWNKMPGYGTSNEQVDTEQEGNTKFNSIQRQEIDDIVPETLTGMVPTKVEILKHDNKLKYMQQIIRPGLTGLAGRRTLVDNAATKEQLYMRQGSLTENNDLKIREISSQINTPERNANQQDYIIKMDGSYYLENNPLIKSTDLRNLELSQGCLNTDQRKQRQTTPFLGKQRLRGKIFRHGQNKTKTNAEHQQELRESNNYAGGARQIQRAVTMKGHGSNMSGFNKRSTLSKDCGDISTQRRYSNEASRFNVDEEEQSNEGSFIENRAEQHAGYASYHKYRQTAAGRFNQQTPINMAESVAQARQQKAYKQSYPMRATMQLRSNNPQCSRKRSYIGALSAALMPNQIELKISKGDESRDQKDQEKDVLSKEIQVIQSKQGMIAEISRTFSSALTHKSDFMRSQMKRKVFDKQSTRIGSHQLQTSDESIIKQTSSRQGSGGVIATGVHTASLYTAVLPDADGKSNSKSFSQKGSNSRQPSFQMQQNQILNKLLGTRVQATTNHQPKAIMPNTGASSTEAIGGTHAVNLNMDLPVTSSSPTAKPSPWTGFNNEARRLNTNQLPKRNQIIGINQSANDREISGSNSMQIQNNIQPKQQQSSSHLHHGSTTNSQILTPSRNHVLSTNMLLPPYIPLSKRGQQIRQKSDDVISQEQPQPQHIEISLMNQTANQYSYFKRGPGEPLVRITKTQVGQNRSRMAQKSASLLHSNTKNRLASMKSHKRSKRGSPKQHSKLQTRFSVERMIKELGDHQSELNLQLINKVNEQASFESVLINGNQTASNFPMMHDYESNIHVEPQRQAQTSSNFYSSAQHLEKFRIEQSNSFLLQSQIGDMTNTTADKSSMFKLKNLQQQKSKTKNSTKRKDKKIFISEQNRKDKQLQNQALQTALSFNRAVGSYLPSKNQADGDMIPMDPIQQIINLNRLGELPSTSTLNEPAIMNNRTRVQSQNQQKRRKMSQAATGMYYEMRKKSYQNFDLALVQSVNFSHQEHQAEETYAPFRTRLSSKDLDPLEVYIQQQKS